MDFFSIASVRARQRQRTGKIQSCIQCGAYKKCKSPRMEPYGQFRLRILNVGEAPGEWEDDRGMPWQGPVGRAMQRAYRHFGFDLFRDCLNVNAMSCRPTDKKGNNRAPTPQEVANCRGRIMRIIEEYKPKVIMLFGKPALLSLMGHRWLKDLGEISRWRGFQIPDRDFNAWLCINYHPSFKERSEREVETIWMKDLKRGLSMIDKLLPKFVDEREQVTVVDDLRFLETFKGPFAFDYETTGLKPHKKVDHQIVCASVCNEENEAFAFMMPKDERQLGYLRKALRNKAVGKIAQNMKFEDTWTYNMLGYRPRGWVWDPMLATHCLDNRSDICGLKFQTYVNFGLINYDSKVAPYLGSDKKNGNSVNRILDLIKTPSGSKLLLTYCGMDSLFEYRLTMLQAKKLRMDFGR